MQPIHLAIGLVEGFVTAGIIGYVAAARPEILESVAAARPVGAGVPLAKVLTVFALLALLTGGAFSWFASTHPDGLEWAIERVTGRGELSGAEHGVAAVLRGFQEKTAFLPDYGFKAEKAEPVPKDAAPAWPGIEAGTSAAGVTGAAIVLVLVVLIGLGIRSAGRRPGSTP
jgi:cobalt/nickel transport system permease protein